jgi:CheY-like chemotaxis protein
VRLVVQVGADDGRVARVARGEHLRAHRPHILVSDVEMPVADGYELIRQVRRLASEEGGRIPAAALTAYARPEDRMRALMAGFQIHVPKPVQPAELVAVVASLAGRTGPR